MINFSLDKNLISGVGCADVNDGGQTHSYGVEALLIWKRTAGVGTRFSVAARTPVRRSILSCDDLLRGSSCWLHTSYGALCRDTVSVSAVRKAPNESIIGQ